MTVTTELVRRSIVLTATHVYSDVTLTDDEQDPETVHLAGKKAHQRWSIARSSIKCVTELGLTGEAR